MQRYGVSCGACRGIGPGRIFDLHTARRALRTATQPRLLRRRIAVRAEHQDLAGIGDQQAQRLAAIVDQDVYKRQDDHSVVRQGFRRILEAQSDMEIVGEASNGREALEQAALLTPDVVVMDVAMPELNGIEATRRMKEATPHSRVLALSMHLSLIHI